MHEDSYLLFHFCKLFIFLTKAFINSLIFSSIILLSTSVLDPISHFFLAESHEHNLV